MGAPPSGGRPPAYPPAGLDRRFYAFALDRLAAWPVIALAGLLAWRSLISEGSVAAGVGLVLAVALAVGAVHTALLGTHGSTPGKGLLGLRVVDVGTGGPIGLGPAALRTLVLAGAGAPTFGLGVAALAQSAVLDPERQRRGWHDRLAGSLVVDLRPPPQPVEPPVGDGETVATQLVNLTAMRLAPPGPTPVPDLRPAPVPDPVGPDAAPPGHGWRVTFDSGETLVVEGLGLVGRRPEGRPGEPVQHLVPLGPDARSVSKTHAQLQVAPDGALVVTDRGSTNGSTLVRSGVARELPPGRPTTLLEGDVVRFGDRTMSVSRES